MSILSAITKESEQNIGISGNRRPYVAPRIDFQSFFADPSTKILNPLATVIASAKGQVVIPKKEREKVGIKPGLRVVVQAVGDHIEIRPFPENPADYFCGIFKGGPSLTKRLLQDPQEERKHEDKKGV